MPCCQQSCRRSTAAVGAVALGLHVQKSIHPSATPPHPTHPAAAACADWIVLALPAGQLVLTEPLYIKRSKLVLRGAGMKATVLKVPKSEAYWGWQRSGRQLPAWPTLVLLSALVAEPSCPHFIHCRPDWGVWAQPQNRHGGLHL